MPAPQVIIKLKTGANTPCWLVFDATFLCRSPVQPSRSSRCGQSVGTETKLSRWDQRTFSWSRVSPGSEQVKVLRTGVSLLMATLRR